MAEVLARFAETVADQDNIRYEAQACGAPTDNGTWEGWIEFIPLGGGRPVRTQRETTQPNRVTAQYWASGISATYLEGALARALAKPTPQIVTHAEPLFNEPAAGHTVIERAVAPPKADAVLNPFSVYEKGEALLRQELHALSAWHLVNIAVAYDLTKDPVTTLTQMTQQELINLIVTAVRAHAPTP